MIRGVSVLVVAGALVGCGGDKGADASATASAKAATSAAPAASASAAPAAAASLTLPKMGKLDAVDYETYKKALEGAGWKVSGSATKSAMYAMTLTLTQGDAKVKLWYYRDGGDSWKKRLEKDGAAIHEAGNVLVGVKVESGAADAKALLGQAVG